MARIWKRKVKRWIRNVSGSAKSVRSIWFPNQSLPSSKITITNRTIVHPDSLLSEIHRQPGYVQLHRCPSIRINNWIRSQWFKRLSERQTKRDQQTVVACWSIDQQVIVPYSFRELLVTYLYLEWKVRFLKVYLPFLKLHQLESRSVSRIEKICLLYVAIALSPCPPFHIFTQLKSPFCLINWYRLMLMS